MTIFVANRGEIAVRIVRAAREAGRDVVVAVTEAARDSLAARLATAVHVLPGTGPAAYLDAEALVAGALAQGVNAQGSDAQGATLLHPGYGFLSESPALARACAGAGIGFVGPDAQLLELFGDKRRARAAAVAAEIPVLPATTGAATLAEAEAFAAGQAPAGVMLKAAAGGGGRGMRAVPAGEPLAPAWARARSEAERGFGSGELFAELYVARARHIEVQIAADATAVVALGERDCTVQRRFQKVIEVAPAPGLPEAVRAELTGAAVRLIEGRGYRGLATVEFLVAADDPTRWWFIEVNPRLQVEHPVTEAVLGVDLVLTSLALAEGATLAELGLATAPAPRGAAVELRLSAERPGPDGQTLPARGSVTGLSLPGGPGVRVDTHLVEGTRIDGTFDSLVAKLITHSQAGLSAALAKARAALGDTRIEGVETNIALLTEVLGEAALADWSVTTRWLAESGVLDRAAVSAAPARSGSTPVVPAAADSVPVDSVPVDPAAAVPAADSAPDDPGQVRAQLPGTVVEVLVGEGERVAAGAPLVVLEAMKMEHLLPAPVSGTVTAVRAEAGRGAVEGELLVEIAADAVQAKARVRTEAIDLDAEREDLRRLRERAAHRFDAARPEAVARRAATGMRTARANIADLCGEDFVEYGGFAVAAQRGRRSEAELIAKTPADGIVTGIGRVRGTGAEIGPRCAVLAYDYTVLAGTQGYLNHKKTDRMLAVAERQSLPVVLFAEGGGGRPGDTDTTVASGLDVGTFAAMGRLSGRVPTLGIAAGRCFAGNAALLGCCDVIIATRAANIGMGGPAMIAGGGLGTFRPEEVGPTVVQAANGVVDLVAADEAEAVALAKRYLGYFGGGAARWSVGDQRRLRHLIPENRVRVYPIRTVIEALADEGSVLELRAGFAPGAVTALVRLEGRPCGLIANNPEHLGGAIDTPAADKFARFLQLCDAHGLPVISLCDTPGFMVGPEHEQTATVRHFSRLFVIGAHLRVPLVTVVLRKGYGLGAQAMAGGGFHRPAATLAWPTGEVGGMGLEGAVQLGYRRELEAVASPEARDARERELLAELYERGRAVNAAAAVELDDVIDPAATRRWILAALPEQAGEAAVPVAGPGAAGPPRFIDTW